VVERELQSLPKGLSETYIRILQQIENQSGYMRNLALNCLAWTIHAKRPLGIEELRYALALSMKTEDTEDTERCLDEVEVILAACGNLLEEVDGAIRPIHYTVQEFLTDGTQQSLDGTIRAQLLDLNSMHTRLSLICLEYIHVSSFERPEEEVFSLRLRLIDNPFASYAYKSFDYHISRCSPTSGDVMANLEKLLLQDGLYLAAALQIKILPERIDSFDIEYHFNSMRFPVTAGTIVFSTGLFDVSDLRQQWTNDSIPQYALHLAASSGLVSAVRRLLEAGCDVNERDTEQSTPLHHACFNTNLDTIKILLNAGAEINAQGGRLGNGLQAASYKGHEPTVKLLLESEAKINAQGGQYGYALHAASYSGHEPVVKLLLNLGADMNAQGGIYGSALQAASFGGHEQIVKLLLEAGADVNAQGGRCGTALQAAASFYGHEQIVKLLLEAGADVDAQGGEYGTALQVASLRGCKQIVKLLLEAGADVNAQGGKYGTALQGASFRGSKQIVKLLLKAGADVNVQGGEYRTALQVASFKGHEQMVKLLLEVGAGVNAQGGEYGTALRAALSEDGKQAVKLLFRTATDLTQDYEWEDDKCRVVVLERRERVEKLLREAGAVEDPEQLEETA
jgi:ankyrin repeat protein